MRAETIRIYLGVLEALGNRQSQADRLRSELTGILESTPSWHDFKLAFLYQKMTKEDI